MDIKKLALNAQAYNDRIIFFQAKAVKESERLLVSLNRAQLLLSKTSKNTALMNSLTGSTKLSPAYANRTGKTSPNLLLSGEFQRDMFLETNENDGTYFIDSYDEKATKLVGMYSLDIFGLTTSNKQPATIEASKRMFDTYKGIVWRI